MLTNAKSWGDNIEDLTETRFIDNKEYLTFKDIQINMYEILKEKATTTPDKIGVVDSFHNNYTYKELLELTDDFTAYLYKDKGISKGSHIGLVLYNSIEFIISYLAGQKLGAVIIPFPTKYNKNGLLNLISKSDCNLIIAEEKFAGWLKENNIFKGNIIVCNTKENEYGFKNITVYSDFNLDSSVSLSDIALIIFTSGTTSGSKGVIIKNYNLQHAISAYQHTLGVSENDSTILSIPIYNVTGLIATFSLFLKIGGTVRIHKFFDSQLLMQEIIKYNITFFHGSPTVFVLMLKEKQKYNSVPSLRLLACGSGNMSSSSIKELKNWMPKTEFRTIYGLSETSSPGTVFPTDAAISEFLGSSGIPIPGLQIKIVDEEMESLPVYQKGEVMLKGTNVISSYYNLDTDLIAKDYWLKTGDIGYVNELGYLYIVDRKKDMINRGGEKIYCLDIENAISEITGVNEVAVVAKKNELYGEIPVAVITVKQGFSLEEYEIKNKLSLVLAKYEIPEEIIIEEEILKTPNGKIDKKGIRENLEKERKSFGK